MLRCFCQLIVTDIERVTTISTHQNIAPKLAIASCAYELMSDTTILMLTHEDTPFASIKIEFEDHNTSTSTIMIHDERIFNKIPVMCAPHLLALAITTIEQARAESEDDIEIYADLNYPLAINI